VATDRDLLLESDVLGYGAFIDITSARQGEGKREKAEGARRSWSLPLAFAFPATGG